MWLSLLIGILLLVTIGGISHPSLQSFVHALVTALCLIVGREYASNYIVFLCSVIMTLLFGVGLSFILRKQSFHRSIVELFVALIFIIVAVSMTAYVLPPSLARLEYGIVFCIVLVGFVYSVLSKTIGGQIIGVACALNALSLVVGLDGQLLAMTTLFAFYGLFVLMSFVIVFRLGRL